jgi:hypothetical protein
MTTTKSVRNGYENLKFVADVAKLFSFQASSINPQPTETRAQ